jgi:hypothetical protein
MYMSKSGKELSMVSQGAIMADADLTLHTSYRISWKPEVIGQLATKRRPLYFTVSYINQNNKHYESIAYVSHRQGII